MSNLEDTQKWLWMLLDVHEYAWGASRQCVIAALTRRILSTIDELLQVKTMDIDTENHIPRTSTRLSSTVRANLYYIRGRTLDIGSNGTYVSEAEE